VQKSEVGYTGLGGIMRVRRVLSKSCWLVCERKAGHGWKTVAAHTKRIRPDQKVKSKFVDKLKVPNISSLFQEMIKHLFSRLSSPLPPPQPSSGREAEMEIRPVDIPV